MKGIFSISLTILLAFVIMSGIPSVLSDKAKAAAKDKTASKFLKEVSKKYKTYKSLKSEFSRLNEPADAKAAKKTEKGSLISKGDKYKFVFLGQEIFCNGKYIWSYTKGGDCTKENYKPSNGKGLNPTKIFSIWEKGFLYASDGSYKKGATEINKIKLTPTDKTKGYFLMNLEAEKVSKSLLSLKISYSDGHKETYNITSQTPNSSISDNTFEFDTKNYPGVEVIDLTK
ncbi:MAG: outer membrane lipoprotein carrier protein LolA [Bacteroidetes bacterium]|nr:outer membrane lipoprotein carrier protein LolA [Bacteroidota bacterium]